MKKLTPEFLKAVGEYMLVETPLAKADICILFGNKHADHLAEGAAELYHQGYYDIVVVTGGVATGDGRLEAHRMRDVLVEKGVPEDVIIIEDKSTNTGENVIFAMSLLEEHLGLDGIDSVIGIGHMHAARRFLMTLERHWPGVTKMFTSQNCYGVPKEEWHTNDNFRAAVLGELDKIEPYKAKGYIREVDMDAIDRAIKKRPQPKKPRPPVV